MFFYIPAGEIENFKDAVKTMARIYHNNIFCNDNLITVNRNLTFVADQRFMECFTSTAQMELERCLLWRLHVLAWAAKHALHLEGDFVECGVWKGFSSAVLCKYLDFASLSRTFYLYDTFCGLPEETSTADERRRHKAGYADDPARWLASVQNAFSPYPNVRIVPGIVPFSFATAVPEKIAYLHIDMNSAQAEIMALEHLFDRMSPGAVLVLDDFGHKPYRAQTIAELEFMEKRGISILELPTGQGLVIKPSAKSAQSV